MAGFALLLITAVALWLITSDLRWLIVALMIVCVVAPMLCAFLYFNYGLQEECYLNIVPHTLSANEEGIVVNIYRKNEPDNDNQMETDGDCPGNSSGDEEMQLISTRTLPYRHMGAYSVAPKSVTLPIGKGFLWIPLTAFSTPEKLEYFMEYVAFHMKKY